MRSFGLETTETTRHSSCYPLQLTYTTHHKLAQGNGNTHTSLLRPWNQQVSESGCTFNLHWTIILLALLVRHNGNTHTSLLRPWNQQVSESGCTFNLHWTVILLVLPVRHNKKLWAVQTVDVVCKLPNKNTHQSFGGKPSAAQIVMWTQLKSAQWRKPFSLCNQTVYTELKPFDPWNLTPVLSTDGYLTECSISPSVDYTLHLLSEMSDPATQVDDKSINQFDEIEKFSLYSTV